MYAIRSYYVLSVQSKKLFQLQSKEFDIRLDPYYLMLEKVTNYLTSLGDMDRLDLARRCFYLKVCDPLSRNGPPQHGVWRRELLVKLVREWGWKQDVLTALDNRESWKVEQVKEAYDELLRNNFV